MMKNLLKITQYVAFFSLFIVASATFAKPGIPVDNDGDTIPAVTGGIPFFKMPNALAADHGEYTWDYSGTVNNNNQRFSLQASVMQFSRKSATGLGLHALYFGFKKDGALFYSDSTYGGENQINQAMAESMDSIQSSASLNHFLLTATSLANPAGQWTVSSTVGIPKPPLFKGFVGQPGREYQLTGNGTTFLWRYDTKTGASTVQPYTYSFTVMVEDEAGASMEGLGGGYVGPQLVPAGAAIAGKYNVESEVSQPRLRVLNWSMQFQAVGAVVTGYLSQYNFSGNSGMLWNDFGPVDKAKSQNIGEESQIVTKLIHQSVPDSLFYGAKFHTPKGLYNGNWLPVEFTRGKYAGASLVFSVFWNQSAHYKNGQSTSDLALSQIGWCNFFAGLVHNQPSSAFSLLETLYPNNPGLPSSTTTQHPPYKVVLNNYESAKYGLASPWVKTVTMTIKANTPLRYALAAYADNLAHSTTADNPSKNVVITVKAISPITQNTLFSSTISQYYEGAGVPEINGKRVGYAWIEQMRD